MSAWAQVVLDMLSELDPDSSSVTVYDIMAGTGLHPDDIMSTLIELGIIKREGDQNVLVRDMAMIEKRVAQREQLRKSRPPYMIIDPAKLRWKPREERPKW